MENQDNLHHEETNLNITPEEFKESIINKITEMLREQDLVVLDMLFAIIKGQQHFKKYDTNTKAGIIHEALRECHESLNKGSDKSITANELVNDFIFASSSFLAFITDITEVELVTNEEYEQREKAMSEAIKTGNVPSQSL